MKSIILASIAVSSFAVLLAGSAVAQNANGAASAAGEFTTKTVSPLHPFGKINTYNVGVDPARIATWAKTLSPGEKQEMVGRCSVIIQNQQNYYMETALFCQHFAIAVAQNVSAGR